MRTNVEKIEERLSTLMGDSKYLKESMDELSEWDSIEEVIRNGKKLYDFGTRVVIAVEVTVKELAADLEDLKSEDKLEAAVEFLDEKIKLPWYAESFDGPAIKMALSFVVRGLNGKFGKAWNLVPLIRAIEKGEDFLQNPLALMGR